MTQIAGGSAYPAAKFGGIGSTLSGVVVDARDVQEREYGTGKLKAWDDGNPVMQTRVTLEQPDESRVSLYVKRGRMLNAVREAVQNAGAADIEPGATLSVTFTGHEQGKGNQPAKTYKASYTRPTGA